GLYVSHDGGDHWNGPLGVSVFNERAIGSIAIKPGDRNTIYAATTQGLGGHSWTLIHNGSTDVSVCTDDLNEAQDNDPCSPFGVRRVLLDPSNTNIVYASSYARGVWRSMDAG